MNTRSIGMPRVKRPQDLAELRVWLWKQWQPDALFWNIAQVTRHERRIPGQGWIPFEVAFDDRALEEAELYWVSAEMAALIDAASRTLPATTLTQELPPARAGLVWFEEPLVGLTAQPDVDYGSGPELIPEEIYVRAILWGKSMIPPGPHPAIGISTYAEFTVLAPAGRTDWEWGEDSDEPIDIAIADDDRRVASMAEDRRWMATFWLLLSQTGMAETATVRSLPKVIRKGKRNMPGLTSNQFDVRVVDVHAPKRSPQESSVEHRHVDWTHRWIVQPHWRQQAYGPGRSLRRPTLIGPYVKGPENKPLKIKPTVHVLKDGEL